MKKLKRYLITIGIGLLISFYVAYTQGIFGQNEAKTIYHILTNSFFVSAVLVMGMGGLIFVSDEGAFDGLTYAMKSFFDIFRRNKKNKYQTFYDYKVAKGDRNHKFGFMIISGLGFLVLSLIMLLLYSNC